jgi:hypothetical protein
MLPIRNAVLSWLYENHEIAYYTKSPSCFLIRAQSVLGISMCRGMGADLPFAGLYQMLWRPPLRLSWQP